MAISKAEWIIAYGHVIDRCSAIAQQIEIEVDDLKNSIDAARAAGDAAAVEALQQRRQHQQRQRRSYLQEVKKAEKAIEALKA